MVRETPVTVVSLSPFLRAAKGLNLSDEEIQEIETAIAYSPEDGDLIEGAGGIRKRRFAIPGRNKGKSGGARIFTVFFHAEAPVYILTLLDKSVTSNLSANERNELAVIARRLKLALKGPRS
jgi:hypothetical protein